MGAGGFGIHVGRAGCSVFEANFHVLLHFRDIVDLYLREIFDEDALFRTLLELHPGLGIFPQQVVYLFVVDFDEAAADEMGFGGVVLGDGDNLAEGARDYAA